MSDWLVERLTGEHEEFGAVLEGLDHHPLISTPHYKLSTIALLKGMLTLLNFELASDDDYDGVPAFGDYVGVGMSLIHIKHSIKRRCSRSNGTLLTQDRAC